MRVMIIVMAIALFGCYGKSNKHRTINEDVESIQDQMEGVWEFVGEDEFYLIIDAYGNGEAYDYMGDSYNNGPNCYRNYEFKFHLDDKQWSVSIGSVTKEFDVTFSDGNMVLTSDDGAYEEYAPSDFPISQFDPICLFYNKNAPRKSGVFAQLEASAW